MASLRFRNGKWQVQVRRHGHTQQAKSFQSKSDAQRWARQIEAELDRTLIPNDVRSLNTITVAQLLTRYRDNVTNEKARQREALRGFRDPSFRMYRNTLRRTGMALRGRVSPAYAVGCDHTESRDHIAGQFRAGMRWERYRQWEVDHIRPLSSARKLSELIALCHFSNLQPLWRSENLRKGGA
ncbi:hypothetical protein ABIF65_005090 [Bradyrhizobium japonicum]